MILIHVCVVLRCSGIGGLCCGWQDPEARPSLQLSSSRAASLAPSLARLCCSSRFTHRLNEHTHTSAGEDSELKPFSTPPIE